MVFHNDCVECVVKAFSIFSRLFEDWWYACYICTHLFVYLFRVTGGELFEDIVAREFYSEADARYVITILVWSNLFEQYSALTLWLLLLLLLLLQLPLLLLLLPLLLLLLLLLLLQLFSNTYNHHHHHHHHHCNYYSHHHLHYYVPPQPRHYLFH